MQKLKIKWLVAFFVFGWLALTAMLLWLSPASGNAAEPARDLWQYGLLALQALPMAILLTVGGLIVAYRRRLRVYLPTFWKYRHLLALMVRRDFLIKYKRSVLGILWTMLNPLANMIILSIVFSSLFSITVPYFPAFVLSGTILFTCFAEATQVALRSVVGNASLLRKVYVPKYIFSVANTVSAYVNFAFSLAALLLVMVVIGAPFHWSILGSLVIVVYLFCFTLGVGLMLSTAYTFFRDTFHLYTVLLTALNYLSAIFFDVRIVPASAMILFDLNPLYHYIRVFRAAMLYGTWPTMSDHMICAGLALVALCVGIFLFYRKQDQFILHV